MHSFINNYSQEFKTMKKIISLALVIIITALALVACSKPTEDESNGVKVIDIALSVEEYAFCVAKDNTDLLASVNAYLAEIKANGKFDAICNSYFGDGTPAEVHSAELDESKDQLVVATSTGFEPFEMVDGGIYSGIDLEIAAGLAEYLGVELVIEDMQFASVVTSVQQGICDIGMAGLTITPARLEIVSFSDSYYDAAQVLLVKDSCTEFDSCKTADDVVAILNTKDSSCKIGCQTGTTGEIYIVGDADDPDGYGFSGLQATKMAYDYAALAANAMVNGDIDYVIVDNAPANAIAKAINNK